MSRVVVIGKPDCHLCEQAEEVVAQVCNDLGIQWQVLSIEDDPELADRYWESIPVVLVDGEHFSQWVVDASALRSCLQNPSSN